MDGDTFALLIVFGSVVSIVFLGIVGGLIKAWIKRGSKSNLSENQEFLSALREFKEKTDKRLSNLEAIVTDEDFEKTPVKRSQKTKELPEKKEEKSAIEIEIENEKKKETEKESGKLRNMLNQ
jgi:hypothetical protein